MRSYRNEPANGHKNLVVNFDNEKVYYERNMDNFIEKSIEIDLKDLTDLSFTDNGLPDSYGILIDDIVIEELE